MDLRQLEIIRAIAEAGSFTGAGERLHVSQSAISRQILLLEEELNEAVFLRVGRRIRITPAGEALLPAQSPRLPGSEGHGRADQRLAAGAARPGAPGRRDDGQPLRLPHAAARVPAQPSASEIKIWAGATDRCLAAIRAGTADCGLLTLPIEIARPRHRPGDGGGAAPRHLADASAGAQARASSPTTCAASTSSCSRAARTPAARSTSSSSARTSIRHIVMETENVEIIKALVRTNVGITIVSFQSVAREFASHQLFCARIAGASLMRRTGWVYAKANRVPRAVQEVVRAFDKVRPKLRLAP